MVSERSTKRFPNNLAILPGSLVHAICSIHRLFSVVRASEISYRPSSIEKLKNQPQSRQLSIGLGSHPRSRRALFIMRAMHAPGGWLNSASGGRSPENKTFCDAFIVRPNNVGDHPVAARKLRFKFAADRRLGCIAWFCIVFRSRVGIPIQSFVGSQGPFSKTQITAKYRIGTIAPIVAPRNNLFERIAATANPIVLPKTTYIAIVTYGTNEGVSDASTPLYGRTNRKSANPNAIIDVKTTIVASENWN